MASNYDMPKQDALSMNAVLAAQGVAGLVATAFNPESSLIFVVLTLGLLGVTIWRPQIDCPREFYRNCFERTCWWKGPPRKWVFDLIWFFMDVLIVASLDDYLFLARNPVDGNPENYYLGVFGLFLAFLFFRFFYVNSFWNYHNKRSFTKGDIYYVWEVSVALGFAILLIIMAWVALFIIMVLEFVHGFNWAGALLILPLIWIFLLVIWTIAIYNCLPHCGKVPPPKCALGKKKAQQ